MVKIDKSSSVHKLLGSTHPVYRPDIDGLRAIAILAVVTYHNFPAWVAGGFVGVDIFFVISGFLISSIILRGLSVQDFSYTNFYIRRIKRTFPALVLVLFFCLGVGWFLLFVDEYKQLGKYTATGAGFLSNFILLREGGYFEAAAEFKPLLHLWSLGIEEQFYLLWPVLVGLFWRWPRWLFWLIIVLASFSFGTNLWLVGDHPDWAFYLPFTRFWELMLGSMLAHNALNKIWSTTGIKQGDYDVHETHTRQRWVGDALSWGGTLLIMTSLFAFDKALHYPGGWALVPSLGAVMMISGGPSAWINRFLLARREVVFVGLISYPLYLWHWPILYFTRVVTDGEPTDTAKGAGIVLAIVLSILTFRYVESPIRISNIKYGPVIAKALCGLVAAQMVIGVMAYKAWIPLRLPDEWQLIAYARSDKYAPRSWDESKKIKPYHMGNPNRDDVLFIGDSHMENYFPRIRDMLSGGLIKDAGVAFVTAGGCPPLPGVERIDQEHPVGCSDFFDQAIMYAKKNKFKKIVLGAYWDRYLIGLFEDRNPTPLLYRANDASRTVIRPNTDESEKLFLRLEVVFKELQSQGAEIFIVLPSPAVDIFDPKHILKGFDRLGYGDQSKPLVESVDTELLRAFNKPVTDAFSRWRERQGVILIDPIDEICGPVRCSNLRDGKPINSDRDHLASGFVLDHANYMDKIFRD